MPGETDATPRTHLGAYALCLDPSDCLLLCRITEGYPDAGRWTLPGGGVDWGEAPDAAVARELLEETGLTASQIELADCLFSEVYPPAGAGLQHPLHHIGILYRAYGVSGRLRMESSGTTDGCAWFARKDAKQLPLTPLGRFGVDIAWPQ